MGLAKFVRNVEVPRVDISYVPKPISTKERKICMYMTHNDESYLPSDGVESIYGNVEEFAKSLDGQKSVVINLEHDDEVKNDEKEKESVSVKEKYAKLKEQVSRDREIFNDPYIDDNKTLRLE